MGTCVARWRFSVLSLVLFGVACGGAVEGPNLDDDQADSDQADHDTVDTTDQDQQVTDTDNGGGDALLPADGDGTAGHGDAGGGDTAGGDTGGGDTGGDSMGGGDDVPPTDDDDPPPPTPVATTFLVVSATTQSALAGTAVDADPEVEVRDQFNAPLPGVAVHFEVTGGSGTIAPTTNLTTNAQGRAKLDTWTLGKSAVANAVRASLPDHAALGNKQFNATVEGDFQIELIYLNTVTEAQRAAFENAAARWQAVIVNELQDVIFNRAELHPDCGGNSDTNDIVMDDLLIFAGVGPIDGELGTLAQAGPCYQRGDGSTMIGIMSFDSEEIGRAHV